MAVLLQVGVLLSNYPENINLSFSFIYFRQLFEVYLIRKELWVSVELNCYFLSFTPFPIAKDKYALEKMLLFRIRIKINYVQQSLFI